MFEYRVYYRVDKVSTDQQLFATRIFNQIDPAIWSNRTLRSCLLNMRNKKGIRMGPLQRLSASRKKRLVRAKKIVGHVPKEVASFGWLWTCWSKRESSSGWTTHGGKVTTPLRMMPCNRAHYPRVAPEWVATEVCGIAWGRKNESFILVTRRKNIWEAVKTAAKAVHWNTKGSWRGEKCQHKSNLCRFSCCFRYLKHLRGVSWNEWTRS